MKRGQITAQIITYISVAIVVVIIMALGYRAYNNAQDRNAVGVVIEFETNLASDIESTKLNLGSVVEKSYNLPVSADFVCFRDQIYCTSITCPYTVNPLLESMADEGNVYVLRDNDLPRPLQVGDLQVRANFCNSSGSLIQQDFYLLCFPVVNSKLNIFMEGAGGRTIVTPVWPISNGTNTKLKEISFFVNKSNNNQTDYFLPKWAPTNCTELLGLEP